MKNDLYARFAAKTDELSGGKTPLLAAFSGGADSTALLLLLADYARERGVELFAVHVHHGLRGQEADRDEEFCRSLCRKMHLPYVCARVDVRAYAEKEKKGVEESARILRYRALRAEADRRGALIVTAHHAGDLLETMLFRIARGTSPAGLIGIPEKKGGVIRPLLHVSKEELFAFLMERGQDYVTDSTNGEEEYARNLLRKKVIPVLRSICPACEKNAVRLSGLFSEDERFFAGLLPEKPDAAALKDLPDPLFKRWVQRAFSEHFSALPENERPVLESVHLTKLAELVGQDVYGKSVSLPGCVKAVFDASGVSFHPDKCAAGEYDLTLPEGKTELPGGGLVLYMTFGGRFPEFSAKTEKIHNLFMKVALDSATICGRLTVRTKQPGDRMRTRGMTRSVSKMIAEVCADTVLRKRYPVICDEKGALWVPGHPPRDGCAADNTTREKICIWLEVTENGVS